MPRAAEERLPVPKAGGGKAKPKANGKPKKLARIG